MKKNIIAIDGYSSCGKSTLAKQLARQLGLIYIDSGAMYRAVALYFIKNKISLNEDDYESILSDISIDFRKNETTGNSQIFLNGQPVEHDIRGMQVSEIVSKVSAIKAIRQFCVKLQQQMGEGGGLVMDGRDIGTTVFPDAGLKIFMTADPHTRAKRRFAELNSKGIITTYEEVYRNLQQRDFEDENRAESPLRKADDAMVLDNSRLNEVQQLQVVIDAAKHQLNLNI